MNFIDVLRELKEVSRKNDEVMIMVPENVKNYSVYWGIMLENNMLIYWSKKHRSQEVSLEYDHYFEEWNIVSAESIRE